MADIPQIALPPDAPLRSDPSTYSDKREDWLVWEEEELFPGLSAAITGINIITPSVNSILSMTDFHEWASLSGAQNAGISTFYAGGFWTLTEDSADITLDVPGASSKWNTVVDIETFNPYLAFFGDGSDGNVTITGTVTLSRDMYYDNLTISGAGKLNTVGYRVFVKDTLNLDAAGAQAIYVSAGVTSNLGRTPAGSSAGGSPGSGGLGTGGAGSSPTDGQYAFNGGKSDRSAGSGGAGIAGAGGVGGSGSASMFARIARRADMALLTVVSGVVLSLGGGMMGPGGGSGAGNGSSTSGGTGGAGGSGGSVLAIFARRLSRTAATAVAAIQAKGGDGANGGNGSGAGAGGGGGGTGGGGGWVYILLETLLGTACTDMVDVSGGAGGAGGTAGAGVTGGASGGSANGGSVTLIEIATDTVTTSSTFTNSAAGNAASGTTGGATVAATVSRVSI